jgi:hypothetical protein
LVNVTQENSVERAESEAKAAANRENHSAQQSSAHQEKKFSASMKNHISLGGAGSMVEAYCLCAMRPDFLLECKMQKARRTKGLSSRSSSEGAL